MSRANSKDRRLLVGIVCVLCLFAGALWVRFGTQVSPEGQKYDEGIRAATKRDLVTALTDFNEAIQLNPRFAPAYELLAATYVAQTRIPAALIVLDHLRQIHPDRPHILTRIAEANASLDASDLLRWAREAVVEEPRSPRAHLTLALAFARTDDAAGARSELATVQSLSNVPLPPDLSREIERRDEGAFLLADTIKRHLIDVPY